MHPQREPKSQAKAARRAGRGLVRAGEAVRSSFLGSQVCPAKGDAGTSALTRRTWRLPKVTDQISL